ncbi:mandelate racemase/muconate lactonizing enzyme family protein [Salinicola rhizosphaerae]|nr:mandelate racemase/muconate lactonizing enzyme family protein [Salinicola rhizosphaerae]
MKITDINIVPANRFLYIQITTDEGFVGIGESGAWGFLDASAEVMETFKQYLLGKNPLMIEHHWQYLYRSFHFRGAAIMGAISAVDIALWDIAGQWFDAPIHTLLGGASRHKVRTYYHVSGETTEALIDECMKAKAQGYTAVGHLSPFLDEPRSQAYFMPYAQMINEAADRVGQLREAVGDEVDLCLELHRRMKPGEAVAFAQAVEPHRPMFLEDPIPPDNFDAMGLVASKTSVPIATGERIHTPQEFQMLLSRNAMTYARTSVCVCGGITGARKIAAIAEAHGVAIVPHNPLSPVSTMACLHLSVAVDNFAVMELPDHDTVSATERYTSSSAVARSTFTQRDMVTYVPRAESGFIAAPEKAGLGTALVKDIAERFPYRRREVNTRLHVDGSVVDQ